MQDKHIVVHNKGNGCIIALLCVIALPVVIWLIVSVIIAFAVVSSDSGMSQ